MKDKNKKLIIVVAVLLLIVGVSFAYFVASVLINGEGAKTKLNTANINGATITVNGTLTFNDLDIYPGHKNVSGIELVATGNGEFVPYNLVWEGTNSLNTPLNFVVYKSESEINSTATCNKTTKIENGAQILAEECSISNIEQLGSPIYNGTINKSEEKVVLTSAEFITATSEGNKVYYYVVLEYPNLNEEQNSDIGGNFNGKVKVEENNSSADITIASIYREESGEYKQVSNIPTKEEKYILNTEKSTCSNSAIPTWNNETWSLQVSSLTISGTDCNLYFDVKPPTGSEIILGNITVKESPTTFTGVATTDEGIFKVADGMYGGTSYYWRGAVTNNYVSFAGFCWRIVRINGDGSIRLIYDGTTCHPNGTSTADSISVTKEAYNSTRNRSNYVGWTYEGELQRPSNNATATSSNAKTQIESWFNSNITGISLTKVANGKFCNDRDVQSEYTWSINPTSSDFYYAAYKRIMTDRQPTLSCPSEDIYILNVGLITVDEAMFAGGWSADNELYYLYNGYSYWTMSPSYWNATNSSWANIFGVNLNGNLSNGSANVTSRGLRPVINLKPDITFSDGNGSQSNPYVVE